MWPTWPQNMQIGLPTSARGYWRVVPLFDGLQLGMDCRLITWTTWLIRLDNWSMRSFVSSSIEAEKARRVERSVGVEVVVLTVYAAKRMEKLDSWSCAFALYAFRQTLSLSVPRIFRLLLEYSWSNASRKCVENFVNVFCRWCVGTWNVERSDNFHSRSHWVFS